jgi:hypothetical protein
MFVPSLSWQNDRFYIDYKCLKKAVFCRHTRKPPQGHGGILRQADGGGKPDWWHRVRGREAGEDGVPVRKVDTKLEIVTLHGGGGERREVVVRR